MKKLKSGGAMSELYLSRLEWLDKTFHHMLDSDEQRPEEIATIALDGMPFLTMAALLDEFESTDQYVIQTIPMENSFFVHQKTLWTCVYELLLQLTIEHLEYLLYQRTEMRIGDDGRIYRRHRTA